ncbi:hypothetical protein O1R50_19540 [Glycomyces luteolus]|uniref:Uncharacterized protein n=1 Tax=Glycomyces luteolus TaxID=2670330 RepID=A0A9X3PCU6_9ACTN|nr:hypothetical protein [Glycomyces luteolus]MDA1361831.1 hypothetical protein [Glycomyces luteolus]
MTTTTVRMARTAAATEGMPAADGSRIAACFVAPQSTTVAVASSRTRPVASAPARIRPARPEAATGPARPARIACSVATTGPTPATHPGQPLTSSSLPA